MSLLEQASLVITPNAYKESKLYSVVPNTTLGDMNVVRATTATRVNSAGLIEVVPYNFLPQSSNIGSWYSQNVTITTGILDENGGNTAITMSNISSGNNTDFTAKFSNPMTLQPNNVVNYSAYLKGTGTIGIQIERGVGGDYFVNNNIITLTNDWVRYNYSFTIPLGVNAEGFHLYITNLTGTTATSVDICFPQVSYGAIKEYFPTTDRLNIPRIDYSNGSCPSILVEPQRTNLLTYSNDFSNGVYNYAGINVSQPILYLNNAISPDGTLNASKLSLPSVLNNGDVSVIYRSPILLSGQNNTSIYLKGEVGNEIIYLYYLVDGVYFNKECVLTTQWKRFDLSFLGGINCYYNLGVDLRNGSEQTAKNAQNIYIYGAQLEQGSYSTSYIPTVASSVTRNADVISKTGISSLIGQTEGTLFLDLRIKNNISVVNRVISLTKASADWTNGSIRADITSGNITVEFTPLGFISSNTSFTQNSNYKIAIGYKANDYVLYVNGVQGGINTTLASMPSLSELYINQLGGFGGLEANSFNSVQLYKTRLSNSELAQLTTL